MARIEELLRTLKEQGGSDLHLAAGGPPRMRLHGHLEHVTVDLFLELLDHASTAAFRIALVAHDGQRVDPFVVDENIHADQIGRLIADQLVVHRAIAAGGALDLVVQIVDHLSQGQLVCQHGAGR